MALQALASGSDCSTNPLQSLTKLQARDRSLQQDRYVPVASSSKAVFRSQRNAAAEADAALFFNARQGSNFDLSPLHRALPPRASTPQWAADFAVNAQLDPRAADEEALAFSKAFQAPGVPGWAADFVATSAAAHRTASPQIMHEPARQYSPMSYGSRMATAPSMAQMNLAMAQQQEQMMRDEETARAQWERAFVQHQSEHLHHAHADVEALHQPHLQVGHSDDELARTAGELLQSVAHEQNDKFANSSFMELMRKLRDREVAVEGNKVVEQLAPAVPASASDKGKQRAQGGDNAPSVFSSDAPRTAAGPLSAAARAEEELAQNTVDGYAVMQGIWDDEYRTREARARQIPFQGDGGGLRSEEDLQETLKKVGSTSWEEDFDAADIVGGPPAVRFRPPSPRHAPTAQEMEWDKLQADWDEFEATNVGIRRTDQPAVHSGYTFRPHNPYLRDAAARAGLNRQHQMHRFSSPLDSVLLKEADAQLNSQDSSAWYDLGVKQQENEREDLAIQALQTAVAISPAMAEAWLALAVSYTNENDRTRAYDAIEMWAGCRFEYAEAVNEFRDKVAVAGRARTLQERHADLTEMLIHMARMSASEELDADVQIALGVLFNTSEEYDKAGDCFAAAMSVRPDDPLLFNRLGATLANSGRSEEAIRFYFKALELQPAYARARYNLAISCINMGSYRDAAEHLLGALSLQEEDAELARTLDDSTEAPPAGSLTSSTLWDTLHMTMSMLQRTDLTAACERRTIDCAFDTVEFFRR